MRNILLKIAFVGSGLSGWQRQKNAVSIQQLIEDAILEVTSEKASVTGCSRTDAGVHAEEFIANFKTSSKIPTERFAKALQTKLPRSIHILRSQEASSSFNARRNSYEKTYRYQIFQGFSPFRLDRWWQLDDAGDRTLLHEAALQITGNHDFSGFCVTSSLKFDNQCSIKQAAWRRRGKELYFEITGDRFLHRMVRFLVGAQIELARGELEMEDFRIILNRPQRKRAMYPAPPEGLYLMKVKYENNGGIMKFFIDTANIEEIKVAASLGVLDGVTTNPSLVSKESGKFEDILRKICEIVDGPISAEVTATDYDGIIREGRILAKIHKNIVVKAPCIKSGLQATKTMSEEGIPVNMTLVFSPNQAIMAAKAGAKFVSPFIGRLDDISQEGMELIEQIVTIYENYDFDTEVLVASVRHPVHVVQAAMLGADICTMPFNVIDKLIQHPLTDIGLARFLADWEKVKGR